MDPPKLPRPKITLKKPNLGSLATGAAAIDTNASSSAAASPAPQTPLGGPGKIRLVSKSQPSTPANGIPPLLMGPPPPPSTTPIPPALPKIVTKAGRVTKPSQKKRAKIDGGIDGDPLDEDLMFGLENEQPHTRKIKVLKTPVSGIRAPTVRIKRNHLPMHPPGDGYDSEAEDREADPVIEEQMIFRMVPGPDCDYLNKCVKEKTIGLPRHLGGADVALKWFDDNRRCMFTVRGRFYAAVLVDLPTITEGTKSWDKKIFVKSADISQMVLAFAQVSSEQEAKIAPLPGALRNGYQWPHGLTPPMHDCRHRRFRKRLSKLEIQNKEAEVERLLAADKAAQSSRWELIEDSDEGSNGQESGGEYEGDGVDYFGNAAHEYDDAEDLTMAAELEAAFLDADDDIMQDTATPMAGVEMATPMTANTDTPAAQAEAGTQGEGDDGSEDEDEDEDEDGDTGDVEGEDGDDDEDRHDEVAGVRVEIANLRKKLAIAQDQLSKSFQPIMRKRIEGNIKNIRSELELKKSSIGDVSED